MFLRSVKLPKYLEDALAPFSWSGVLSNHLKDSVITCILCVPECREQVTKNFVDSLNTIMFLNPEWKEQVSSALLRFSVEGFKK